LKSVNQEKVSRDMQLEDLKNLNISIGLTGKENSSNARGHRPRQLLDYYTTIKSIIKKLSTKRTLYIYDFCCGRSYLSFYVNYLLKSDGIENVEFICVDWNAALIKRNKETAKTLKMANMKFFHADVMDFEMAYRPDIIYSLHACDIATDIMIYKGITHNARFILSVSCCQHRYRKKIKNATLAPITKHKAYKERLVDMVVDSMRAILLEKAGYKVTCFEFTSTTYTDKNIMLKCENVGINEMNNPILQKQYNQLASTFNVEPILNEYLTQGETKNETIYT